MNKKTEELYSMNQKMIIEEVNIIETLYCVMIYDMFKYDIDFEKDKLEEIIA